MVGHVILDYVSFKMTCIIGTSSSCSTSPSMSLYLEVAFPLEKAPYLCVQDQLKALPSTAASM